ncbi:hypothetical protein OQY15_03935 [Pedobacter sp. MC2016-15]|uniref:HD domain-containing protein n=1 Tax=Pedobacter sp. MC2016-15 TaxID=2994473 RepID=UPI0022462140|nr:hypothetical protein [Pedobacter sp. MC2016-15]MCX2478224.1 hypothetical protein [Pedobacter sp. MC2016-15]
MKLNRLNIQILVIILLFTISTNVFAQSKPDVNKQLENNFKRIVLKYKKDPAAADILWTEIVSNYSGEKRHYHTMEHLQNFYVQLQKCRKLTTDPDLLFMASLYHDVIYNSEDHRDEERSAELAVKRLGEISYPAEKITKCKDLILATKTHALSADADTNYFNDADMTILGLDQQIYERYVKNVRLEYGNTPQFDAGRKRILQYFLKMDRIYKTDFFNQLYEKQARANIAWEISTL